MPETKKGSHPPQRERERDSQIICYARGIYNTMLCCCSLSNQTDEYYGMMEPKEVVVCAVSVLSAIVVPYYKKYGMKSKATCRHL
jgi:hypothetical protein